MARAGEGMALDRDREFARLEDLLVKALKGEEEAYQALMADPFLPGDFKRSLRPGGLPAQFAEVQERVAKALRGDEGARRALLADPTLPPEMKVFLLPGGVVQGTLALLERVWSGDVTAKEVLFQVPWGKSLAGFLSAPPSPALRAQVLSQLKTLEDRVVAQAEVSLKRAEAQALSQVPAQVVSRLEGIRLRLKDALQEGVGEALRRIFLFSALFIGLSLLALAFLPDLELTGGLGPRPSLE